MLKTINRIRKKLLTPSRLQLSSVVAAYKKRVLSEDLLYDEAQMTVAKLMDKLGSNLSNYESERGFKYLLSLQQVNVDIITPRGLYLWGSVGSGKTMLMDTLYETCQVNRKRRVHFHKFCLEIHKRIHHFKQKLLEQYGRDINVNITPERDAIRHVAIEIANEATLLCFDEFQITDIADAMIMKKLFSHIW
jgi:protein AFG1